MVKPKSNIWKYFKEKKKNNQTVYSCIYCDKEYAKNVTRMADHLVKCLKCPKGIRICESRGK